MLCTGRRGQSLPLGPGLPLPLLEASGQLLLDRVAGGLGLIPDLREKRRNPGSSPIFPEDVPQSQLMKILQSAEGDGVVKFGAVVPRLGRDGPGVFSDRSATVDFQVRSREPPWRERSVCVGGVGSQRPATNSGEASSGGGRGHPTQA